MLDVVNVTLLIAEFCGIPSNSIEFCPGTQLIHLELVENFRHFPLNVVSMSPEQPFV